MLKNFLSFDRVVISGDTELFPHGIDWKLQSGLNVVTGGTGLGKTTLVNAILFALLGEFGQSRLEAARISKEYFRGRLAAQKKKGEVFVCIEGRIGKSKFSIWRNLQTGLVQKALVDGQELKAKEFRGWLNTECGLDSSSEELGYFIEALLFLSEQRFLISWDNVTQSQITMLLFGDHSKFLEYRNLWDEVQSADSTARNLRHQAGRMEDSLADAKKQKSSEKDANASSLGSLETEIETLESEIKGLKVSLEKEKSENKILEEQYQKHEQSFQRLAAQLHAHADAEADVFINLKARLSPVSQSFLHKIASFEGARNWVCPCCGKAPRTTNRHLSRLAELVKKKECPICEGPLTPQTDSGSKKPSGDFKALEREMNALSGRLNKVIYEFEKSKSRIEMFGQNILKKETRLAEARMAYTGSKAIGGLKTLEAVVKKLRDEQHAAEAERDSKLAVFNKQKKAVEAIQSRIQKKLIKSFEKFSGLFIDADCKIVFDAQGNYAEKRGPQVTATHSAFYPVIDGKPRTRPQMLSEAQRTFIDLAFRMAVLEVWRDASGIAAPLIVETPEGSVDIAYMIRVADLLRAFASEGHQVLVTTNINNDRFLPRLLEKVPQSERVGRVLDLMKLGVPRSLQLKHKKEYDAVLQLAFSGASK